MMKIDSKTNPQKVTSLLLSLVFLSIFTAAPNASSAKDNIDKKAEIQKINTQNSDKMNSIAWYERFQIEFYGGFTTLNPSDLNLFVDYDNSIQEFHYDSLLDYLQSNGQIRSWNGVKEAERKKIKNALPLGGRLRYHVNNSLAISIGFRYFSREHESDFDFEYTRNEIEGEQYSESSTFFPYSLSVKAYVPHVGIHLMKKVKGALMLEGYFSGGPLFAECSYFSNWRYEWRIREANQSEYLVFQRAGTLEEKGTGTGIAIDLGGRIKYPLIKNLGIFLEAGYAYQVVKNVSGSGSELNGEFSETWDGRWAIKQEQIRTPWGELEAELPTNFWPDGSNEGKVRDFELNLSGFQLRLGLSFRF